MQISQCVPKEDLVPLSLDVIQDSSIWLTHKSGQSIVASILRRKNVTIACMRPINHSCCCCHWLTRDAAAESLPLPRSLATKLLAQMRRPLAVVGCRTEVQAGNILGCICIIYTSSSSSNRNPGHHISSPSVSINIRLQTALFASARRSVCAALSVGEGPAATLRAYRNTHFSARPEK
jgi:hypothetical protein